MKNTLLLLFFFAGWMPFGIAQIALDRGDLHAVYKVELFYNNKRGVLWDATADSVILLSQKDFCNIKDFNRLPDRLALTAIPAMDLKAIHLVPKGQREKNILLGTGIGLLFGIGLGTSMHFSYDSYEECLAKNYGQIEDPSLGDCYKTSPILPSATLWGTFGAVVGLSWGTKARRFNFKRGIRKTTYAESHLKIQQYTILKKIELANEQAPVHVLLTLPKLLDSLMIQELKLTLSPNQAQPLFVLNGNRVPKAQLEVFSISHLSSITILNGNEAPAIYGSEAAAGAFEVVTTSSRFAKNAELVIFKIENGSKQVIRKIPLR